jgi:hypothetical protein
MPDPIPVNLVVEDPLSEAVVRRVLQQAGVKYAVGSCYRPGGFGYIKKKIGAFNHAAKHSPFFVLTDLDKTDCAPALIRAWLREDPHPNLLFRVAVREVESWLLADAIGFAGFLGINVRNIPENPDEIVDPKRKLIDLARTSRRREPRDSIIPRRGSTAKVGPDYNGRLTAFVAKSWNLTEAAKRSGSLRRFRLAAESFRPLWP